MHRCRSLLPLFVCVLLLFQYCSTMLVRSFTRMPASKLSRLSLSTLSIEGKFGEKGYRAYFRDEKDAQLISPWHDIPLRVGKNFNFISEISKYTREKMEVNTKMPHNPISQDILSSGEVRSYHGPIFWNYGCFPQTWENPHHLHPVIKKYGDNDPLDVVEIGSKSIPTGSVEEVNESS